MIAAFGLFEGKDIKSEDAGQLITQGKKQGLKPDWEKKDAVYLKILQIMKRRDVAALKKATDPEEKEKLEEAIELWIEEIEEWKEDIKSQKEESRDRISEIHSLIEGYPNYKSLSKKPAKAEIKGIVEAMDKERPEWEYEKKGDLYLINNLASNFKHLRSSKPRPSSGKGKEKKSFGCLSWCVLGFILWGLYMFFSQTN